MAVETEDLRDVRVLRLSNGPANILSIGNGMVAALAAAMACAQTASQCRGIVITGADGIFCGGADLGDLDRADELRRLFEAIEMSAKPVVMAICGQALGGGVELALAGHWRIAERNARFALPEVGLGLLPGLGGTQRLPRLVGADCALDIMLSGRTVTAEAALFVGLVDAIIDGDVVAAAIRFVRDGRVPRRRTGTLPPPPDAATAVAVRRKALRPSLNHAPERILDCVASISDDFAAGMRLEAKWLDELVASEASRGLRHAFFSHRVAMHIPGLDKGSKIRPPATAHIFGQCAHSQQIAAAMLASGVKVFDGDLVHAAKRPDLLVMMDSARGAVEPVATESAIMAFPRRSAAPRDRYGVQRAGTSLEFHCAEKGALMEVIRAAGTAPTAMAAMAALGKAMGRTVVVSGDRNGSIFERLIHAYVAPVRLLLASGTPAERIDLALRQWGMAEGPIATGLLHGLITRAQPGVALNAGSASDEEIVELCLLHLIDEGARLIDEEVAWRSADIDIAAIAGLGFPRERGGPMFQADRIGLPVILARLHRLHTDGKLARKPAVLIEELMRTELTFADDDLAAGRARSNRRRTLTALQN